MKSCMENMIFFMMIIASAWSRIVENSTQYIDDRFDCYPSCHSWQICCPSSGDCVDYLQDCDYCKTNCDCGDCEGRYTICCKGECVMYEHGCDLRYCGVFNPCDIGLICCDEVCVDADEGCQTTTTSTTSTSGPNCNDDFTICTDLGFDYCCDKGDGWQCMDLEDCMGISEDALWGIGIAAAVSIIAVPILCCCCCGGCALYFILKSRKKRQGQVHQPGVHMMQPHQPGMQMMQGGQVQQQGYPTAGFVAQQPGYEQGNQAGETYHGVPNPENVK